MEDLVKKMVYAGVGVVAAAAEKIQSRVDVLVEKGNISKEEGKKVLEDFIETTESKKDEVESKVRETIDGIVKSIKLPSVADLESLINRIESLEARIDELAPKTRKKATTTRKKATSTVKKTVAKAKTTVAKAAKATTTKATKVATEVTPTAKK